MSQPVLVTMINGSSQMLIKSVRHDHKDSHLCGCYCFSLQRSAAEYELAMQEFHAAMAATRARSKKKIMTTLGLPLLNVAQICLFVSQFSAVQVLAKEKVCTSCTAAATAGCQTIRSMSAAQRAAS